MFATSRHFATSCSTARLEVCDLSAQVIARQSNVCVIAALGAIFTQMANDGQELDISSLKLVTLLEDVTDVKTLKVRTYIHALSL